MSPRHRKDQSPDIGDSQHFAYMYIARHREWLEYDEVLRGGRMWLASQGKDAT